MIRKIIKIDDEKCNGCGICATACHEQAIQIINGKARLISDHYCDGLGNCLPVCPTGAITFEEREAAAYDEAAVKERINSHQDNRLSQWPVQIKLVPTNAPYFDGAHLLIAADCCAYSYGNFHRDFIAGRITLIGCPKLDREDYTEKLTEIIHNNNIKSITVARMEVPCCSGMEAAVKSALTRSKKEIPLDVLIIAVPR